MTLIIEVGTMRKFLSIVLVLAVIGAAGYGFWYYKSGRLGLLGIVSLEKSAEQLEAEALEAPASELATKADFEALADSLSGLATISYDGFGETGATGVTIAIAAYEDAGITIDELSLYGLDLAGIENALDGGDWDELRIADRVDAKGVESFGLELLAGTLVEQFMGEAPVEETPDMEIMLPEGVDIDTMDEALPEEVMTDSMDDTVDEMAEMGADMGDVAEQGTPLPFTIKDYSFSADRMVMDGFTVYPMASHDLESPWGYAALFADFYRASAFDLTATWNMTGAFDMDIEGMSIVSDVKMDFIGEKGWHRGDLDLAVLSGMVTTMSQQFDPELEPLTSKTEVAYYGLAEFGLSGLLEHVAAGALPPTTETDILSLGKWYTEGQSEFANGQLISTTESSVVDLSSFHWLIPTHIGVDVEGLSYKVPALTEYLVTTMNMGGEGLAPEQQAMIDAGLQIVEDHDLSEPTIDLDLSLSWDPENGETAYDLDGLLRGEMAKLVDLDLVLPTYADLVAAPRDETTGMVDMEALGPIFAGNSALAYGELALEDFGLIEKLFSMVIDGAKLMPADQMPQASMIAAQTPEGLRQMISGYMRAAATQVSAQFPPAQGYILAFADFIAEGGTLRITVAPAEPLTAAGMQALASDPNTTPQSMVDTIGLDITQEGATE